MSGYVLPWLFATVMAAYCLVQGLKTHGVLSGVWFLVSLLCVAAGFWIIVLSMPGT